MAEQHAPSATRPERPARRVRWVLRPHRRSRWSIPTLRWQPVGVATPPTTKGATGY